MHILQLPFRALQIAFSAVALALSVVLINGQLTGTVPALSKYEAFCGAFGIIVAAVGIVAAFVEKIPGLIMAAVDVLTTLFFLAGSVALAVKLKVHSCSPDPDAFHSKNVPKNASPYTYFNDVINAGGRSFDIDYPGRCKMAQADCAFLFFALGCFIASVVLDLVSGGGGLRMGKGKGAGSADHV